MKIRIQSLFFLALLVTFLFIDCAAAQDADAARKKAYLDVALVNLKQLKDFTWTMKAQINPAENKYPLRSFFISWQNGKLQKKETGDTTAVRPTEETDWVNVIAELVLKYIGPEEKKVIQFYEAAHMEPDSGGLMEISGSGFVQEDDKVTIDADKIIYIIRRLTFTSILDEDDMMGTIEYEVNADSFKYPSSIKVDVPAKRLRVVFENSDFKKH